MRFSLWFFSLLCSGFLHGQDIQTPVVHGTAGYLRLGTGLLSLESSGTFSNSSFNNQSSSMGLAVGVGGSLLFLERYLVEVGGTANFFAEAEHNRMTGSPMVIAQKANAYSGVLSAGYVLFNQNNILIYPGIGIGWMTVQKRLTNQSENTANYGPYPVPAGEGIEISLSQTIYDIKISAQKLLALKDETKKLPLGLDIGYRAGMGLNEWNDNEQLQGTANMWYASLRLGFGVFRR